MGKYDPLRHHLAKCPENVLELSMHFDEIQRLVGRLPRSAYLRPSWWRNTFDAGLESQAVRPASWCVKSVSFATETVVFARSTVVPAKRDASPEPTAGGNCHPSPGEEQTISSQAAGADGITESHNLISQRIMVADLAVGLVAAAAAGATAIVGLTHLPLPALVLLAIAVGATAFTMTQAIVSRRIAALASRWWTLSTALVLLVCAGAFTYHKFLDPATYRFVIPFTATVKIDPSQVVDQVCRTIVLPSAWHNIPTPAEPLTDTNVNRWETSQRGVDGEETAVVVELQGRSDHVVTIGQPMVIISSRQAPIRGSTVELSGGCGGMLRHRIFAVNLDQRQPRAIPINGAPFPRISSNNRSLAQASSPSFTISARDSEYFVIVATTKKSFCRWFLVLTWESMGRSGVLYIKNGNTPFATTAPDANPRHSLIFGAWQ